MPPVPAGFSLKKKRKSLVVSTRKYKYSEVKLSICFITVGNTVLENYVRKEMKGREFVHEKPYFSAERKYFHNSKPQKIRTLGK